MREQDNRRTSRQAFDVFFKPVELFLSKSTQAALLNICNVDQPGKVHAFLVKAVPSSSGSIFPESFPVLGTVIVEVVLARHIEYILCSALFQELGEHVELFRLSKMR